jgi:hypothetical protein
MAKTRGLTSDAIDRIAAGAEAHVGENRVGGL